MSVYLPTAILDPFEKLRPFPSNPQTIFQAHWHELVLSALFYYAVQSLSSPLCTFYLGSRYTSLPRNTRIDFDVHVTSMVQCVVSTVLMIYHLNNPHWQNRLNDPVNSLLGSTPFGSMVGAVTAGYFVWDLFVCMRNFKLFGIGFLLHAVAAMYAFCCGFVPYCQPWAAAFLSFELSTPFVNMNWFASRMPKGTFSDKFVVINGLLLILVFFLIRIVWGLYAVSQLAKDMMASLDQVSIFTPAALLTMNFALNVLNIFWFYKMVRIAIKKAKGKSSTRKASKATDKIE